MKTTYLVYKQVDGVRQLVAATQEEWDAIMKGNRGLPMGQRRCFMKDCFEDGDELALVLSDHRLPGISKRPQLNTGSGTAKTQSPSGSAKSVRPTRFYLWTPGCPKPTLSHCTKASPRPLTLSVLLPTTF